MLLCMSWHRTLIYLDRIGETFDTAVMEWKGTLLESMINSEVINLNNILCGLFNSIYLYVEILI